MIHYHGTPITPKTVLAELAGRNFCVSYAAPGDLQRCHSIGQSVMIDNGAFTLWKQGGEVDWGGYYDWAAPWLDYHTTWAVIPDVIDGDVEANDDLIREWPFNVKGAPVWHLHEPIDRLLHLADLWPRIGFGSSGDYKTPGSDAWHRRMEEAFNALCGNGPPPVWTHMLRGMQFSSGPYPFASVDSADIARNHNRPQNTAPQMALRWDSKQPPARWEIREQLEMAA